MNKKQAVLVGLALVLLFAGTALATSINLSASSDVIIYAFDQNPPREAIKVMSGSPFTIP